MCMCLCVFVRGQYEFGKDAAGNILLIDEVHTPDSSRYWVADTYADRTAQGLAPDSIDKEFLRLWFRDNCDPYKDEVCFCFNNPSLEAFF